MVVREGPPFKLSGVVSPAREAEALYSPACKAYQGPDQQFIPKDMTAGDDMNLTIIYIMALSNMP
jgi:hypothetical protein